MTAPTIVLRMDLTGTAFGTAPTWTDYTTHLTTAGDGEPISITRGRQDEQGEVQPATCSFVLENPTGQWTPGNGAADADWDVGTPVNVRLTHDAVTYDRFTGFVDNVEPEFPGADWSRVRVTCTDISARLGRSNKLRSILEGEALGDGPTALWPCDDAAGSSYARNAVLGARGGVKRFSQVRGTDDYRAFGGPVGSGGLAGDPSGSFEVAGTTDAGFPTRRSSGGLLDTTIAAKFLSTSGHGATVAGWVKTSDPEAQLFATLFEQRAADLSVQAYAYLWGDTSLGGFWIECSVAGAGTVVGSTKSAVVTDDDWHQWAITVPSGGGSIKLYIDGAQTGTSTTGAATVTDGRYQSWGGPSKQDGSTYFLNGAMKHLAVYDVELSAAQVLAQYQAGAGAVERTDERFARIAASAGLTVTGLPTGLGTMGQQVTVDSPAIEALAEVARSENGPMFVTREGALTMRARDHRYGAAVVASFTAADVNPDVTVRRDRQGMVNEMAVSRQGGEQPQIVKDTTSQTRHGRFEGSTTVALSTDSEAYGLADWTVATHKNPATRLPSLTVDLLTARTAALATAALTVDIGDKIEVTGLPSQAPASTFTGFAEGYTETFGADQWSMSFFTSPVTLEDSLFTLDDPVKGVLDAGYVLGY